MGVVRAAVLLFGWTAGQQLQVPDRQFYERYFFDPVYGQSAYWAKQSDHEVILTGRVFDWNFDGDPNPQLGHRGDVLDHCISTMEEVHDVDFEDVDLVVVVLGVPLTVASDGGSFPAHSSERSHAGIVTRTGDRFDFLEHEIGHAIGLSHSFGNASFQIPGTKPGEYAHPYCVMSAMAYGGIGTPSFPSPPREGAEEYLGLGPSLNAATALARGWVDAFEFDLAGGAPVDVVLRSRSWGGRNRQLAPQALNVRAADGRTYVVEYRENQDWDAGQPGPAVIVSQGRGSTADGFYPGSSTATFLAALQLPITFGGRGSTYSGPGFELRMLDVSAAHHTVRLTVSPVHLPRVPFVTSSTVQTLRERQIGAGETTFEPGELVCVEGTWPYREVGRTQVATFEATYELAVPPLTAVWTVDGNPLPAPAGSVGPVTTVHVAGPRLRDDPHVRVVLVRYEIEPLPTGSRLRLFNREEDETHTVDVTVTLSTDLGSASADLSARFEGRTFVYPPDFSAERWKCLVGRVREKDRKYEVVVTADGWRRAPEEKWADLHDLLGGLAVLHERDEHQYRQGIAVLGDFGISADDVRVVERDDVVRLRFDDSALHPPLPLLGADGLPVVTGDVEG